MITRIAVLFVALALSGCPDKDQAARPPSAETASQVDDADTADKTKLCARAVDRFLELMAGQSVPPTSADVCAMTPTEIIECQIAATTTAVLTDCYKQAATAPITIDPDRAAPSAARLALCARADSNARTVLKATLTAARGPRIQACVDAKAVHATCQIAAATPQAWAACDPTLASPR